MKKRRRKKKLPVPRLNLDDCEPEPIWHMWLALSPAERLVRAWAHRSWLVDPQAAHDAKYLLQL